MINKFLRWLFSGWNQPPPLPPTMLERKRYVYECRGEKRENGKVVGYGTYRFDSAQEAYTTIRAMLGGNSRSGQSMFDYMTPLERIDLDTGERSKEF